MCGYDVTQLRGYEVTTDRVVDGDTVDVDVDLGFDLTYRTRLRLIGVDTPEKVGSSKEAGLKAKAFTENFIKDGGAITLKVAKRGKFGRPLAFLVDKNGKILNQELVKNDQAKPYCGGKRGGDSG